MREESTHPFVLTTPSVALFGSNTRKNKIPAVMPKSAKTVQRRYATTLGRSERKSKIEVEWKAWTAREGMRGGGREG